MTTKPAPDSRRLIMQFIKRQGQATAGEVAGHLGMTREGARQQLQALESEGLIARGPRHEPEAPGRPAVSFQITSAGDHTFAKHYDTLSLTLVDTVAAQFGVEAVVKLLDAVSEQQVKHWAPRLEGLSLPERMKVLKGIYFEDDPYTTVRKDQRGYALVERNCPFLNVAMSRPLLCNVTVNTLTRLLGVRVEREERFQNGDKRCVFRILEDQPVDLDTYTFQLEKAA